MAIVGAPRFQGGMVKDDRFTAKRDLIQALYGNDISHISPKSHPDPRAALLLAHRSTVVK